MKISKVYAREILDSRGNPTVETDLELENGIKVRASVPSGASTGENEAIELRDGDKERYQGKGVLKAVENVNSLIRKAVVGQELEQAKIDQIMLDLDGTRNKAKLGANAILSVSMCVTKALAKLNNKEIYQHLGSQYSMPVPMMNIINGGAHASSGLEIQEFMIVPKRESFKENLRCGAEVFHSLKSLLADAGHNTSVGDEGGFAPNLATNEEALDYIIKAIEKAGYLPGVDVFIALDSAATEFFDGESYTINKKVITKAQLISYYESLIEEYPIISIEDAFAENDIDSIKELTKRAGDKIMLVGDDFFVTNIYYLLRGISENYNNAILLKPNQIGTITEMLATIELAKNNDFKTVVSHRSGETEDTFIAHAAVGLDLGFIKTGSLSRGERIAKYNELLRIEEQLNNK